MKSIVNIRTVLLLSSVAFATLTSASTIISNLGTAGSQKLGNDNIWAEGFSLSSTASSFTFDSVALRVYAWSPEQVVAAIYSDDGGGHPGTALTSLTPTIPVANSISDYIFTPDVPLTLDPSSTYWIVLSSTQSFSVPFGAGWVVSDTPFTTSSGIAFVGTERSSDGTSWTFFGPEAGNTHAFAVNATAIPEPSSMILFSLFVVGLIFRHER
jgi:hypothetical protein